MMQPFAETNFNPRHAADFSKRWLMPQGSPMLPSTGTNADPRHAADFLNRPWQFPITGTAAMPPTNNYLADLLSRLKGTAHALQIPQLPAPAAPSQLQPFTNVPMQQPPAIETAWQRPDAAMPNMSNLATGGAMGMPSPNNYLQGFAAGNKLAETDFSRFKWPTYQNFGGMNWGGR